MIRYLALEGIDGAGKDTQLALVGDRLQRAGVTPIVLHEPSYGPHGRALRARLPSMADDVDAQRALFTQDRADHRRRKIDPALAFVRCNDGFAVLQNRSVLSAAAYQPLGDGDDDLIATVGLQLAIADMPELVVVLDVDVEEALRRIEARGSLDVFERRKTLERVRTRYRRLAELVPACVLIDASGPADVLADRVTSLMSVGED